MKRSTLLRAACALSLLLALLPLCCGCSVSALSSLRAFAKPYEGEYACEYAAYGGQNLLRDYREIVLTLENGTFTLTAVPHRGKVRRARGRYEYDGEGETIAFRAEIFGKERRRDLPFRNGKIFLEQSFAGKKLVVRFAMK